MFARWIFELFIRKHHKRTGNPPPGVARHDNVIKIAPASRNEWIGKFFPIFVSLGGEVVRIISRIAENNPRRTLRPHHGNFSAGPRVIDVTTQMFRRHHIISTTIGFARDHRDFWHRRFSISIKQLCTL